MTRLVCFVVGHRYVKTPYPGADTSDGFYLRCLRCSKGNDPATTNVKRCLRSGVSSLVTAGGFPGAVTATEAESLVGLTHQQAQAHAQEKGFSLYVTGTDGVLRTGRASYVSRRVRVALLDGVVVAVRPG